MKLEGLYHRDALFSLTSTYLPAQTTSNTARSVLSNEPLLEESESSFEMNFCPLYIFYLMCTNMTSPIQLKFSFSFSNNSVKKERKKKRRKENISAIQLGRPEYGTPLQS
jgi:hypothetical protein